MKSNKNVKLLKVLAFPASAAFMLGVGVTAIHADDDVAEPTPITAATESPVVLETSDNETTSVVETTTTSEGDSTSEIGDESSDVGQNQEESNQQEAEDNSSKATTPAKAPAANQVQTVSDDSASYDAEVAKETYTIKFDANGGSGAPDSITAEAGSTITLPTIKPTASKEGYEFLGWAYSATGTSKLSAGSSLTVTKDQTLYAIYKKAFKLVYHWADGSTTEDTRFVSDSQTSTTANLYNRIFQIKDYRYYDGKKVIGFASTEGSTEVEYQLYQRMTLSDENPVLNVYSVFGDLDDAEFKVVVIYKDGTTETRSDAVTATVKCKNDGLDHPSSTTLHKSTYADVYNAALNAVTIKDHYTVTGFAEIDGDSYTLRDGTSTSTTQFNLEYYNGTYYLIAEKDAYDYTLKFDAKGGENAPEEIGVYKGEKVTIPETTPTREGYTFKGWTTDSAAKSKDNRYNAKRTVSLSKDTTLYAVWEKTYSVVYHLSTGGTSVDDSYSSNTGSKTVYTHSRPFQIADYKAQVAQGKKLIGWTTVEGGTEVEYGLGAKIDLTEDKPYIDLYSVYGDMDDAKVKVVVVTKDGNTYTEGEAVDTTVRCKNEAVDHPTSGSMHQNTLNELYATATGTASIPAHYSIVGFSYHTNSAGEYELVDGTSTSQLNYYDGTTLYLIVEKETYSYSIYYYGGNKTEGYERILPYESGSVSAESTVKISETVPEKEGYKFLGWTTLFRQDLGIVYQPGDEVTIDRNNKNLALLAVWEAQSVDYSVKFTDDFDNDYGTITGQVEAGGTTTITIPDTRPTHQEGLIFQGWVIAGQTHTIYKAGDTFEISADNPDVVLYAHFTTGGGADVNPGGDDSGKDDPSKGDDSKKDDTKKDDTSGKTDTSDKKEDSNKSDTSDKKDDSEDANKEDASQSEDANKSDSSSTVTTISYVANTSGSTATSESTTSSSSDSVQTSVATNGTLFSTMAALSGAIALAFFKKRDDE